MCEERWTNPEGRERVFLPLQRREGGAEETWDVSKTFERANRGSITPVIIHIYVDMCIYIDPYI